MWRFGVVLLALSVVAGCAPPAFASDEAPADLSANPAPELRTLDRLVGQWVLEGTIAGERTVHDVTAAWVLGGNYVLINETSRERGADGRPQYEAAVYVGWLASAKQYVCLWLDNTAVMSNGVTCAAAAAQDAMPFEFRNAGGKLIFANRFTYHPDTDSWDWLMDDVQGDALQAFGRVTLHRRPREAQP